jgi:hypothetical protein
MKHALLALVVRALQSANARWGSEELSLVPEAEYEFQSGRWRRFVSRGIEHIRGAYKTVDHRYRKTHKQPLPLANFFKSQSNISAIFPSSMSQSLRGAAREAL